MLSSEDLRYKEERKYYQMELKAAREELDKCQSRGDRELSESKVEHLENYIDMMEHLHESAST